MKMYNIWKIISIILWVLAAVFMAWAFISWAEIIVKNLTENPVYHNWNMFILFFSQSRGGENDKYQGI